MNMILRGIAAALLFCALASSVSAQFQTPVLDGTVSGGEYAHSSGNWSMTWDDTYLYVGKSTALGATLIYLDVDPRSTPTAGSDANGSKTGVHDRADASDIAGYQPALPFRADVRVRGAAASSLRLRDGAGGWGAEVTSSDDILTVTNGSSREIRIRWAALPGLTGRPTSFRWYGVDLMPGALNSMVSDPMPASNAASTVRYYLDVASTANGAATNPFSAHHAVWTVTTESPTGTGSFEEALMLVQGTTGTEQQFIVFDLPGSTTIQFANEVLSNTASKRLTIDGTTQPGFVSTPVVVLRGASTSDAGSVGLALSGAHAFEVRGLVFQNFHTALSITGAASATIAGNYVGTDVTGSTAAPNHHGIAVSLCTNCTIGGATAADGNLVSGNIGTAITIDASNASVVNNSIGTTAGGNAVIGGTTGLRFLGSTGTIAGNVLAGHSGNAIHVENAVGLNIFGNRVGVGANGTTALPNSGSGLFLAESGSVHVGGLGTGEANVIANNGTGIALLDSAGGVEVRGNAVYNNTIGMNAAGGAVQPVPSISSAALSYPTNHLTVVFSATSTNGSATAQALRFDLYDADPATPSSPQGKTYRATSPCYAGSSLTNQSWNAGAGFTAEANVVLVATSYADPSCSTPADGSSAFSAAATIAPAQAPTTVVLSFSGTTPARINANQTYTAHVSSELGGLNGTVTFTANGVPINGCINAWMFGSAATCIPTTATVPDGAVVQAHYSGDATHETSSSTTRTHYWVNRIFTGPGNFSDATKWSGGFVPLNNESIAIVGTCTFDSAQPYRYSKTYLGNTAATGTLVFTAANPNPFHTASIASLTAGSSIDMTSGGIFRFDDEWNTTNMTFTAGTGTVQVNAPGYLGDSDGPFLPAQEYNNIEIYDPTVATAGSAVLHGTLHVDNLARLDTTPWNLTVQGSATFTGNGPMFLGATTIPAGSSLTYARTTHVQLTGQLVIDGTVTCTNTNPQTFGGNTYGVSGSGTLILSAPFGLHAEAANDYSDLEMRFVSTNTASAAIPAGTYRKLVIDRPFAAMSGSTTPVSTQTLVLNGVLTTNANTLTVTSTATDAVSGTGRVNGTLTRHVSNGAYAFPVGTSSASMPATLTFSGVTSTGTVSVAAIDGEHPSLNGSGIDAAKSFNAYWRVTPGTAAFTSFSPALTFTGNAIDAGANSAAFATRARANGTWQHIAAGGSLASALGAVELAAGEQLIDHYVVSAPASVATGSTFTVTVTARDLLNVTANNSATSVTLAGTNLVFDANGNGTFDDAAKILTAGVATISAKATAAGATTITATDASAKAGTSSTITAGKATTTTSLGSSANPSAGGQSVTFTATVTSAHTATITGTVTFRNGATILGSVALSSGTAAYATSALAAGTHSITATYEGDATFNSSVSPALSQVVATAFGSPSGVTATATSASAVTISWIPVNGATTYEVFRATVHGNYALLQSTGSTVVVDSNLAANTTYLYRVRAIGASTSPFSSTDAATTVVFTNATLTGTTMKAVHVAELRTAVNAMRTAAGLPAATFTAASTGTTVKAAHVTELRTALDAARTAIGLPPIGYTDASLAQGIPVKAAHVTELRGGTQ